MNALLQLDILAPAWIAGLLVLATHVPLGQQVLARGIVFIDLAIAQIAALGVVLASTWLHAETGWAVQAAAFVMALLGALLLTWTERRWPDIQEALIGTSFVLAACASLVAVAGHPHGGEHLQDLLAGQILWVNTPQLLALGALSGLVLLLCWPLGRQLPRLRFYMLFALAVTAAVQAVGVYLVFASLILPAIATRRSRRALLAGYALGAAAYAAGLLASAFFDAPSGPLIVLALGAFCLPALLLQGRPQPSALSTETPDDKRA